MGSKSKSSTSQDIADNSANAGTNSIAASGGAAVTAADNGSILATGNANIHIEQLSDDVAMGAISGMRDISAAFMQNMTDSQALTYRENADARSAANIANETNAALAGQLASLAVSNVAESKRDPDNQLLTTLAKYGAWLVAGLAILTAFVLFRKK